MECGVESYTPSDNLISHLIGEAVRRFSMEEELRRNRDSEAIINSVLELSLGREPLDVFLQLVLDRLMAVQWLGPQPKGAIFLQDSPGVLVMKAHSHLSPTVQEACGVVPVGHCVCGRTARVGRPTFADHARPGMEPHHHYSVPILSDGTVLGVLSLYLTIDHRYSKREERFLRTVAAALAGAILRKRAEQEVDRARDELDSFFTLLPDPACVASTDGHFEKVNPAWTKALGWTSQELVGSRLAKFIHPEDVEAALKGVEKRIAGEGTADFVNRHRCKDGSYRWIEWHATSTKSGTAIYAVARDITERKRLEERLLRAQRLETAGRVAGQVAHDFGNLLVPLATYVGLIRMRAPEDGRIAQYCDVMEDVIAQMAEINQDLMALGRRGNLTQHPTDLNEIVEQVLAQMPARPDSLELRLGLAPDLMPVNGSPTQLLRMISNLVSNAREAMLDDGVLRIRTENARLDKYRRGLPETAEGDWVKLTVADTGGGIPPQIRDKIFDLFFTTKVSDEKRGSGLGLSIVQAILQDHGGHLDVESKVGEGTAFTMYLPAAGGRDLLPLTAEIL